MIRLAINVLLGFGYVLGTLLVWIGIEMYVIDGARLTPSLLSVATGVVLWELMVGTGRSVRRTLTWREVGRP